MRSKIINISLPEQLLRAAETVRREEGISRSELFRTSLRSFLARKQRLPVTARLAELGGAFDFLKDEPDLYAEKDIERR